MASDFAWRRAVAEVSIGQYVGNVRAPSSEKHGRPMLHAADVLWKHVRELDALFFSETMATRSSFLRFT